MAPVSQTRKTFSPQPAAGSVEQISDYLGIGRTGVFDLIKNGRLPAVKIGRRTVIRYADADRLLSQCMRVDVFG